MTIVSRVAIMGQSRPIPTRLLLGTFPMGPLRLIIRFICGSALKGEVIR